MTTTDATELTGGEATPARKPTRAKNPSYDVFRQDGDDMWQLVMSDVKAPNRKEAIVKATIGNPDEAGHYGSFAVIKHGEFKTLTRARKVEPQDVWS